MTPIKRERSIVTRNASDIGENLSVCEIVHNVTAFLSDLNILYLFFFIWLGQNISLALKYYKTNIYHKTI